jgi:hypothetical protein
MDLRKELAKGQSKALVNRIVKFIGNDPKRFAALIRIFIEGPYRITQHAARPLAYSVERHEPLVKPHLKTLLRFLKKPGIPDAVKRNTVRLFQFIEIPRVHHGTVVNLCFQYLADVKEPVAIRVFSMTVLCNIAMKNPELKTEVCLLIEDQLPYASPAFRSRGNKVLKKLRQPLI